MPSALTCRKDALMKKGPVLCTAVRMDPGMHLHDPSLKKYLKNFRALFFCDMINEQARPETLSGQPDDNRKQTFYSGFHCGVTEEKERVFDDNRFI